jgi:hypothetical protein
LLFLGFFCYGSRALDFPAFFAIGWHVTDFWSMRCQQMSQRTKGKAFVLPIKMESNILNMTLVASFFSLQYDALQAKKEDGSI